MNEIQPEIKPKKRRKEKITERHITIIKSIAEGYTNLEIAKEFQITEARISKIISKIFEASGTNNRPQLVNWAYQNKILKVE